MGKQQQKQQKQQKKQPKNQQKGKPKGNGNSKNNRPKTYGAGRKFSEAKVVKVDSLNWKPVDIPDNLDDYEGFYGLEEIDGVDVEIVNGQAEFRVRDDKNIKKEEEEEKEEKEKEENDEEKEEDDESEDDDKDKANDDNESDMEGIDDEEFTGFDDLEESEESEKDDESDEKDDEKDKEFDQTSENKQKKTLLPQNILDNELQTNAFNSNVSLPDDNVELPHWKSINLDSHTLAGLHGLKFTKPTPIQKEAIPLALEGKDVIGKATTGSGKTLAYGIPILEKYLSQISSIEAKRAKKLIPPPTGIIFTPTRELAHQVVDHLDQLSKYFPLNANGIVSLTGGLSIQKQERLLKHGPGIIVATPGRCLELLEKDQELIKTMGSVDILVLDEADRLLQDGHFEEFERILTLLKTHRPKLSERKWQTLVFSATFSRELFTKLDKNQKSKKSSLIENDEILPLLNAKLHFKDKYPSLVDANPKEIVSGQITEALVECGGIERDLYLYYFLLVYKGSTLVFANSIDSVKRLVPFLNNLNIPAFAIHSSMIQKQRLRSLERFKAASENNEISVLVASDVAARGLDIPNIDHVAHYHLPRSADVYIHRSGRTARAGNEGVSVMFCSPQEASGPLRKLRKLVASSSNNKSKLNMKNDVKLLPIEMDLVAQIKDRVDLSATLADSNISGNSNNKEQSWVKQAADDLGIDDIDDYEDDITKKQRRRKEFKTLTKDESKGLRYELKQLLNTPLRKLSRRSYLTSGLENLAHIMVSSKTNKDILGHKHSDALTALKGNKVGKKGKGKVNKK